MGARARTHTHTYINTHTHTHIYIYIYIYIYSIELILRAIAMRNNDYLSLINFKVKLHCQRLFFINEHDEKKKLNLQNRVHL